jgi:hypothetical protein
MRIQGSQDANQPSQFSDFANYELTLHNQGLQWLCHSVANAIFHLMQQ